MACSTPLLNCCAHPMTSLPLQPPATPGALPSPLTHPNLPCTHPLFPPRLLDPNVSFCSPSHFPNVSRNTYVPTRPCYVIDLASQDTLLRSQIPLLSLDYEKNNPPNALDKFVFISASFGHMIFSNKKTCFLFDVFTGFEVSPPPLPVDEYTGINYGVALTGPLASPNSHLIVHTESYNFYWRVGSNSWSKLSLRKVRLTRFVVFKGQVFGMRIDRRLFMVHLTPQIHLQEMPVSWGGRNSMTKWHLDYIWLVVCRDMFLMVGCPSGPPRTGAAFEAYRLDTSTEPAKWVKVERLEKWAIFISNDHGVGALSCMNPERWGGRSDCVYCYDSISGHLVAFELGKPLHGDDATCSQLFFSYLSYVMAEWCNLYGWSPVLCAVMVNNLWCKNLATCFLRDLSVIVGTLV